MKKVLSLCAFALVFTLSTNSLSAQDVAQDGDYKSNIYVGAGFSLVGGLFDALGNTSTGDYTTKSLPAIQLNYDYALSPKISAGVAFSYQGFGFDVVDFVYFDANGNTITESFTASLKRTNVALRIMYNYGNSEKLDMYSGVRLGMTNWNAKTDSTNPDNNFFGDSYSGWGFAPQVVPFGIRYFVTDNIGLSLETAIGAPHFLSIGANYRL